MPVGRGAVAGRLHDLQQRRRRAPALPPWRRIWPSSSGGASSLLAGHRRLRRGASRRPLRPDPHQQLPLRLVPRSLRFSRPRGRGARQGRRHSSGTIIVGRDSGVKSSPTSRANASFSAPRSPRQPIFRRTGCCSRPASTPRRTSGTTPSPPVLQAREAIFAVVDGAFDAGAGPALDLEVMEAEGKLPPADYRVIAAGRGCPTGFSSRRRSPDGA